MRGLLGRRPQTDTMDDTFDRRRFAALCCGAAAAGLAGCAEPGDETTPAGGGEDSPDPQEGPVVEPNDSGTQDPGMGPAGENETIEDGVDPDPREGGTTAGGDAATAASENESAGDDAAGGTATGGGGTNATGG